MASERQTFAWAATTYPLPTATGNSLLKDADPAIFYAIDYWRQIIQTYLGARWTADATAAGLKGADANPISGTVVQQVVPFDPTPFLRRDQFKFPLLAVYRVVSVSRDRTIAWETNQDAWGVAFILPPLSPSQAEQLWPFLHAVRDTIVNRTTEAADSSYANGALVWSSLAKVELIGFTRGDFRPMQGLDELVFPALTLSAYVHERQQLVPTAYDRIAGIDADEQIQPTDGAAAIDNFVQVAKDLAASYASGWQQVASTLTTQNLADVWGSGPDDVWAVGAAGTILHYNGLAWSAVATGGVVPVSDNLAAVWGTSANNVFVVGSAGSIYKFDGFAWSVAATLTGGGSLADVDGSSATSVYAVGSAGKVLFFNGTTWTQSAVGSVGFSSVIANAATDVWAFATNGTIQHYTGAWASVTTPTSGAVGFPWSASASDVYAPLNAGGAMWWNGTIWATVSVPSSVATTRLNAAWLANTASVWLVGAQGTILFGSRNGFVVLSAPTSGRSDFNAVHGFTPRNVYAVGSAGMIMQYST